MAIGLRLLIAVAVALAVVIIALVAAAQMAQQRRQHESFRAADRPKSGRVMAESDNQARAENHLLAHQGHVKSLAMRPLTADERTRFVRMQHAIQARFVNDPTRAIVKADQLIADLLYVRGYPIHDFEQCVAELSARHPSIVQNYRAAHATAQASARGEASIEDMRTAILLYRAVCAGLLKPEPTERRTSQRRETPARVRTAQFLS